MGAEMTTGPPDVVPASSVDVLPLCTRQRLSDVLSLSHALVDFPHGRHLRLPKKYTPSPWTTILTSVTSSCQTRWWV